MIQREKTIPKPLKSVFENRTAEIDLKNQRPKGF